MLQQEGAKHAGQTEGDWASGGELLSGHNLLFVEELYEEFERDPSSVSAEWRAYFEAFLRGDSLSLPQVSPRNGAPRNGGYASPSAASASPSVASAPPAAVRSAAPSAAWRQEDTRSFSRRAAAPASARQIEPAPINRESRFDLPTPHQTDWNDRLAFLRNFQFFRNMSKEELAQVASIVREKSYEAGAYLCHEGELGESVYIIVSGQVQILRQGRFVVGLGPGEVVGELSVIDSHPRSADVLAMTALHVLEIHGHDFQKLMSEHTSLMKGMMQVLVARVRETSDLQERVAQLVRAYREKGHALAKLDPLGRQPVHSHPELTITHYGLTDNDLDTRFSMRLGREVTFQPLRQILDHLHRIYCGAIGIQYMHVDNLFIQEWLRERMEDPMYHKPIGRERQLHILQKLTDAELFETFLHKKFLGAKRFSLEGAESLIPLLDQAIEKAGEYGVQEVVIGMAHRGRLNVLSNILQKPSSQIFREFEDVDLDLKSGGGDVKYHMGYSYDKATQAGGMVHLSLCFNPSHLEAVGPVVLGRVRAKQDRILDADRQRVLPLVIHGDAAFIGQGVVQETFNMSELPGYTVGGTVHIVVNNQIGFTTAPEESRSSEYATDIARMLQIPVFHVNGENPDAVDRVIQIAMEFRHTFKKDVVIDMYCYRRHGHNEGDEPAFTQPLLYKTIAQRQSVREAYLENLLKLGEVTQQEADEIAERSRQALEEDLAEARSEDFKYKPATSGKGLWSKYKGGADKAVPEAETHVPLERIQHYLKVQSSYPKGFKPHRKLLRQFKGLKQIAAGEAPINWGVGELLAFASLLDEGYPVRLTGQDSQRGTFSHRHAAIRDVETGQLYIPLQHIGPQQGPFSVYNSPLSETGVLGFEFGYSLDYPDGLVIWEAQFGDFCNMAQVIFDQFISSSETKWSRLTGICMLLPHGFEGQGPEHSSARLERFLTLAAEDNMQIVNLTTPAQLFHCLRRQLHRPLRKPLVVMSPKSLLRHKMAISSLEDFTEGRFHRMIPDVEEPDPAKVKKVLLCSGKVYYDLIQERADRKIDNVVIMRLEQYYPFPLEQLYSQLARYPKKTPFVWVQEEPENMGAWPFLCRQLYRLFRAEAEYPLSCVARPEAASPAVGSKACHDIEQAQLLRRALRVPG